MKLTHNTILENINIIKNPQTKTIVDRYLIVSGYSYNKTVLDIACGVGHGSGLLYNYGAKSVLGIDNDTESVNFALNRYKNKNINFINYDITTELKIDTKFDIVCSIETFEHLPKDKIQIYLSNLKNAVTNDGTIFITTPIRYEEKFIYRGSTHLYEYSYDEFKLELDNQFLESDYNIKINSIVEFKYKNFLQTDLIDGVDNYSRLFFAIIKRK